MTMLYSQYQEWLEKWKKDPHTGQKWQYWRLILKMLQYLPVALEQLKPEIVEQSAKKVTKSYKTEEKIILAFRHFLKFCHNNKWLNTLPELRRGGLGSFREVSLPAILRTEIEKVLKEHRTKKIGEPLTPEVVTKVTHDFEGFYSIIVKANPDRSLTTLSDFIYRDLDLYQRTLENTGSLYRAKPMSPRTVVSHISHILTVFNAAKKINKWEINPMDAYELPKYQFAQRDTYLTKDQVHKLCDPGHMDDKTLREQFFIVRNVTMAAIQYDCALRQDEVVKLLELDLLWQRQTKGGLLPIIIRGRKGRPSNNEDLLHLTPTAVSALQNYLKIKEKYCSTRKLILEPLKDKRTHIELGMPIFITESGTPLSESIYEAKAFPDLVRKNNFDLHRVTTHTLRHSRIAHWLEDGLPIDRVSRLANHRNVNFTMKVYAHYQPNSDRDVLEEKYGEKPEAVPILTKELLPERNVRKQIIKHLMEILNAPSDDQRVNQMEEALFEKLNGRVGREQICYSVIEAMDKIKIGRTQIYEWMRKKYLHPVELSNGRKGLLKQEIDKLSGLRTSREAAIILGYKEKIPTTIQRLVREGLLKATKIGNEYLLADKDLADFLLWKNSYKRLLGTRPHQPRGRSQDFTKAPLQAA